MAVSGMRGNTMGASRGLYSRRMRIMLRALADFRYVALSITWALGSPVP